MKSGYEILLKRDGDIGLMEIKNPPQNYLEQAEFVDSDMLEEFVGSGIKALIIVGNRRHFSAGADLKSIQDQIKNINHFHQQMENGNHLLNYIDTLEIPVISAISGVCFGAGLEIALACDIRICEQNALFAFPEINHELFPGLGGTRRLAELTGKSTALELVLNGDMINVATARKLRLVDEVVDKKKALIHAIDLAKKMTNNRSLDVIHAVMRSLNNSKIMEMQEVIKNDAMTFGRLALKSLGSKEH
jgi:enoyl-CoA hydratase/carnithine racemase